MPIYKKSKTYGLTSIRPGSTEEVVTNPAAVAQMNSPAQQAANAQANAAMLQQAAAAGMDLTVVGYDATGIAINAENQQIPWVPTGTPNTQLATPINYNPFQQQPPQPAGLPWFWIIGAAVVAGGVVWWFMRDKKESST